MGTLALVALVLSGALALGAQQEEGAVAQVELPTSGLKSGQLTAKQEKAAAIDGREYPFHPTIVFADDEGNPRDWQSFKRGDVVQYRLKQGQLEVLILVLPK
jgi:hypothetical protein